MFSDRNTLGPLLISGNGEEVEDGPEIQDATRVHDSRGPVRMTERGSEQNRVAHAMMTAELADSIVGDRSLMNASPGSETIRLTMAQAIVKYLQAQFSERDGNVRRLIPGDVRHLRPRQRLRHGPGA